MHNSLTRRGLLEANIDTRSPITENTRLQLDGILSATLHNAGTTVVTLNNHLTIRPGATMQIASPHYRVVINCTLDVRFAAPVAGQENKLEVMESRIAAPAYHNFTRDDPTH